MKIESLRIGMKVRHPQYGSGLVKTISEAVAEIQFDDGSKRAVAPEPSGLEPAEPQIAVSGLNVPLNQFVNETVSDLRPWRKSSSTTAANAPSHRNRAGWNRRNRKSPSAA